MNFEKVLKALIHEFQNADIDFALVGGLALILSGVDRKTHDIDFMVPLQSSEKVDRIMSSLGYERLYRTENVANYSGLSVMGQVDFLFAHRKYSVNMLKRALKHSLLGFIIKVIRPEDLIGLKVQSSSNDPRRAEQDNLDIKGILRFNLLDLDLGIIKEYYKIFNREEELDRILNEIQADKA